MSTAAAMFGESTEAVIVGVGMLVGACLAWRGRFVGGWVVR
jgi:hypothetical protein